MSERLPPELHDLVQQTLDAARLPRKDRARVESELECHFADGLERGQSVKRLSDSFGDARVTGQLIGSSGNQRGKRLTRACAIAATLTVAAYGLAFLHIHRVDESTTVIALAEQAESVQKEYERAVSFLREPGGLPDAYRVAAMLRRQQNLWSETAALMLLDQIMEEAEFAPADVQWLADSVRALGAGEGWEVRQRVIESAQPYIVQTLYGRDGRIGPNGRRIIVLTKGGLEVPLRAVLLEPLFFARARSAEELRNDVHALVAQRVQNAQTASRRLCVRARCDA